MSPTQKKTLLQRVASESTLNTAWRKVRQSCMQSTSPEIKNAALIFEEKSSSQIKSILHKILRGSFVFPKAIGVIKPRPGKKPRNLVVAAISSRIVQRAIFDTITNIDSIKLISNSTTSFGGVKGGNVKNALEKLCSEMDAGARHYFKSDIIDFFNNIPRNKVLDHIYGLLPDTSINDLLRAAVTCELANAADPKILKYIDSFPRDEVGVVQGCCLSTLFGNILLNDFDHEMNSKPSVCCIRYVDDFLIVGRNRERVVRAANKSKILLGVHGLTIHPILRGNDEKSKFGLLKDGVGFLGCVIYPTRIRPGEKAVKNLLSLVNNILHESLICLRSNGEVPDLKRSFIRTLYNASNTIKGWGHAFSFCTDSEYMSHLDNQIHDIINKYIREYSIQHNNLTDPIARLNMLGIHLISGCNKVPQI